MQEIQQRYRQREPYLPDHAPWNTLSAASAHDLLTDAAVLSFDQDRRIDVNLGIVVAGALAVERESADGRRALCTLFHEGNLVDLRRVDRMRQGSLVALTASRFLALDEAACEACTAKHTDIASALTAQLREQFARLRDHATDLAFKTPFERLASVLFEFRRWPGANLPEHGANTIRIPMRRSDIADYIGVKAETVSRAIRKLEQERLIGLPSGNHVVLIDVPSMRRLANGGRPRQSTRSIQ